VSAPMMPISPTMPSDSLLIVAWFFPPDGGAGSQRPASFARESPGHGWKTTVATRGTGHDRGRWETRDDSLLLDLENTIDLDRVEIPGSASPGSLPVIDGLPDVALPLGARVLELVDRDQPSVVLLTMSPFWLSALVEPIRARSDARIVVDLRDPWTLDYWPIYRNKRRFQSQQQQMLTSLAAVDGVIMNTQGARRDLLRTFGERLPDDFESRVGVIENGFSRTDFPDSSNYERKRMLEIVHAGTFHCEHLPGNRSLRSRLSGLRQTSRMKIDRTGRTPHHLLNAARMLADRDLDFDRNVRFRFIGHVDDSLKRCVKGSGIAEKVTLDGYQTHSRIVGSMCEAGALFLPGAGLPDGVEDLIVPGKTYEYLASRRPILGAIDRGDARRLLERAGGSYLCEPCSTESISAALERLHADWCSGVLDDGSFRDQSVLGEFERSRLASRLDAHLRIILELPPRSG
jgi:glycosyltransferase involved in cell wall biosynthesis